MISIILGQNKNRPKLVKEPRSSKLCSSLWCITAEEYAKCTTETDTARDDNAINKKDDSGKMIVLCTLEIFQY